jgi:hypothetical protein
MAASLLKNTLFETYINSSLMITWNLARVITLQPFYVFQRFILWQEGLRKCWIFAKYELKILYDSQEKRVQNPSGLDIQIKMNKNMKSKIHNSWSKKWKNLTLVL